MEKAKMPSFKVKNKKSNVGRKPASEKFITLTSREIAPKNFKFYKVKKGKIFFKKIKSDNKKINRIIIDESLVKK